MLNTFPFGNGVVHIDKGRCYYCDKPLSHRTYTRDHIIPKFRGGCNNDINIVPACTKCNTLKGHKLLTEFIYDVDSTYAIGQIEKLIEYVNAQGRNLYRNNEIKEVPIVVKKEVPKRYLVPIYDLMKGGFKPEYINTIDFHDYSE